MIIAALTNKNHTVVLNELLALDDKVQAAALVGLNRGMQRATSIIQRDFLNGPRPKILGRMTGNLSRSITSYVQVDGKTITAFHSSDMPYAAYHEYGYHGFITVRGYERRISRLSQGRSFNGRAAIHRAAITFVRSHERLVHYHGRPFLAPGLEKAFPLIIDNIEKELQTLNSEP